MKHTPTPWTAEKSGTEFFDIVGDSKSQMIASVWHRSQQFFDSDFRDAATNAAFIVRACNSYDVMVTALQKLQHDQEHGSLSNMERLDVIENALAKAEGR